MLGCALPPIYALCYAPIIARFLMAHGWNKWFAFLVGVIGVLSVMYFSIPVLNASPQRFQKLWAPLALIVWVLPLFGIIALALADIAGQFK